MTAKTADPPQSLQAGPHSNLPHKNPANRGEDNKGTASTSVAPSQDVVMLKSVTMGNDLPTSQPDDGLTFDQIVSIAHMIGAPGPDERMRKCFNAMMGHSTLLASPVSTPELVGLLDQLDQDQDQLDQEDFKQGGYANDDGDQDN